MHPTFQSLLQRTTVLLILLLIGGVSYAQTPRILVFSKTAGFRHTSIEPGKTALLKMGQSQGFAVDTTEDASKFNETNLKRYATVVFLCTTGDVLDAIQQNAFERYIQAGGGYVGLHSATDTEYDWPWYGKLAGGYSPATPARRVMSKRELSTSKTKRTQAPTSWPIHGSAPMNFTISAT